MTHTRRLMLAATIAAASVTGGSNAAAAGKRVVVLDIEGARDARLQKSIAKLVRSKHEMVSARKFMRTAKRLRVRRLNTDAIAKVCGRMAIDAVVRGTLIADDDERYVLKLRVQEGASGRTVKKVSIRLRAPRLSRKMRRAVQKRLLTGISRVASILDEDEGDMDDEDDSDRITEDSDDDVDDSRALRNSRRRRARKRRARKRRVATRVQRKSRRLVGASRVGGDDDDDDDDDDKKRVADASDTGDDDDDNPLSKTSKSLTSGDKMSAAQRARNSPLRVDAGLSVTSRTMSFTSRADFMEAPNGYKGPAAPGVRVSGEIFPLAMDKKRTGSVTRFGIGFMLDRVVGLTTNVAGATESADLQTTMQRYNVSLVYRHQFGDKDTSPTLRASVGYNKLKFRIDRTNAPSDVIVDLPNTLYKFVDPGLSARFPLSPALAVNAGAKVLLVLDTGAVQKPEEYGTATVTGLDASVGVDYIVGARMLITVEGHFTTLGYDFNGDGMQTTSRDGDPSTVDVGGASDRYLGASATLGYLF